MRNFLKRFFPLLPLAIGLVFATMANHENYVFTIIRYTSILCLMAHFFAIEVEVRESDRFFSICFLAMFFSVFSYSYLDDWYEDRCNAFPRQKVQAQVRVLEKPEWHNAKRAVMRAERRNADLVVAGGKILIVDQELKKIIENFESYEYPLELIVEIGEDARMIKRAMREPSVYRRLDQLRKIDSSFVELEKKICKVAWLYNGNAYYFYQGVYGREFFLEKAIAEFLKVNAYKNLAKAFEEFSQLTANIGNDGPCNEALKYQKLAGQPVPNPSYN